MVLSTKCATTSLGKRRVERGDPTVSTSCAEYYAIRNDEYHFAESRPVEDWKDHELKVCVLIGDNKIFTALSADAPDHASYGDSPEAAKADLKLRLEASIRKGRGGVYHNNSSNEFHRANIESFVREVGVEGVRVVTDSVDSIILFASV